MESQRKQLSEPFINFSEFQSHISKNNNTFRKNFRTPYIKHQYLTNINNEQFSKYSDIKIQYQDKDQQLNEFQVVENVEKTLPQMLRFNRQNCKKSIQQDASKLRHQIWLIIQKFFRKVQQYCDNFYQNLQETIQNPNPYINLQKGYKTDRISMRINLSQSLKNNTSFYNSQKMNRMILHVIMKIQQCFQQSGTNTLNQLISIPLVKAQNQRKQVTHKSFSAQKLKEMEDIFSLSKNPKNEQFQILYNKIVTRQEDIRKNQADNNQYGLGSRFYQGNINDQYQYQARNSFISAISKKNDKHLKFVGYQSASIPFDTTSTPFSKEKTRQINRSSRMKKIDRSIDRITMSPIINRVMANTQFSIDGSNDYSSASDPKYLSLRQKKSQITIRDRQKNKIKYWVGNTHTSAVCQWCQQISINPNVKSIILPTAHNNSASKQAIKGTCLCFCNQQDNIAVGCTDSFIYIIKKIQPLNFSSSQHQKPFTKMVAKLVGHSSTICCLFEQDKILFSGGDVPCCSVILWNTRNWTIRSKVSYHSAAICSIIGILNTNYIITSSFDRSIKLLDYSRSVVSGYSQGKDKLSVVYTKLFYYEHLQRVVAVSPSTHITALGLSMNAEEFSLFFDKGAECDGKITNAEKSATKQKNLLILGLQKGVVQIYNVEELIKIKTISINIGSLSNMIIFSRNNKSQFPLILCLCHGSKTLKVINTQTGHIGGFNIKECVDIMSLKGMGPTMVISSSNQMAWVNKNTDTPRIVMGQFEIF